MFIICKTIIDYLKINILISVYYFNVGIVVEDYKIFSILKDLFARYVQKRRLLYFYSYVTNEIKHLNEVTWYFLLLFKFTTVRRIIAHSTGHLVPLLWNGQSYSSPSTTPETANVLGIPPCYGPDFALPIRGKFSN